MKFHSFYTKNLPDQLLSDHKKVCEYVGINVEYCIQDAMDNYDELYSAHGQFMTNVMDHEDVACFLDIDCLPHNFKNIRKAYDWAVENKSFVGNAQNISHTEMRNHAYAAASFLIVTKDAWNNLGCPDLEWFMQEKTQVDTAQILSLRADQIGMPYRLMYPIGFDGPERYELAGYGSYGTGTLYPATWHYFRISRFKNHIPELWSDRVDKILKDQKINPNYSSCYYGL